MFYEKDPDEALRFGDILKGFVLAFPCLRQPDPLSDYKIDVSLPPYCAVLSPCCSIGQKVISLCPLIRVPSGFFGNPYFAQDLTRINRKMTPQEAVPPQVWKSLPEQEKPKRLQEGFGYALYDKFIYDKHDLLPSYQIRGKGRNIETNYYMVDFRYIQRLNCERINTPKDAPLESKCLQLSIPARSELRQKIGHYYSKVPIEDKVLGG